MATSPNYGWLEPDNTDLVKNGALAIRTLGNAIDTTMATMTPKSTVTAKGDIVAATAASTPARLAVGNNGETLVADSSTSTGLRYTAGTVQANPVLNSAMQIWQRGTSVAGSTTAFSADRWQSYRNAAGSTFSRQATNDTTNLPNIQYCARVQRDSGNTSTVVMAFFQNFESINSIPYAGKTVTFSFYARAGANYSPTSSLLQVQLISGTGTDQNVITGYTGSTNVINQSATLTTTWQRFSYTGTVATTATELVTYFSSNPTGTAGAADYFEITGVQIDIASVALPFRTAGVTYQQELAACQRYYVRYSNTGTTAPHAVGSGYTTTAAYALIHLPVEMRISPSAIDYSGFKVTDGVAATALTSITLTISDAKTPFVSLAVAAGLIPYRPYFLQQNSTSDYLGFTAEL